MMYDTELITLAVARGISDALKEMNVTESEYQKWFKAIGKHTVKHIRKILKQYEQ